MNTIEKEKDTISTSENVPKVSFWDKVKYFFSNMFSSIGNFFKNLFGKNKEEPYIPRTRDGVSVNYGKTDEDKDEKKDKNPPKEKEMDTVEPNKKTVLQLGAPTKEQVLQDEPQNANVVPELESGNVQEPILLGAGQKTRVIEEKIAEIINKYKTESICNQVTFKAGSDLIVLEPVAHEIDGEEYQVGVDILVNDEKFFSERSISTQAFRSETVHEGKYTSIKDALSAIEELVQDKNIELESEKEFFDRGTVMSGTEVLDTSDIAGVIVDDKNNSATIEIIESPLLNSTVEEKPLDTIQDRTALMESVKTIDARISCIESNENNIVFNFEIEDESIVKATVDKDGKVHLTQIVDSNENNVEANEIGFVKTSEELKQLIEQNPNIITKIYTSVEEVERREKEMFAQIELIKVNDIEELKTHITEILGDANRNKIIYDMAEKTLSIKLPTADRDDGVLEMGRHLKVDLTTMKTSIETETMQMTGRGGYETESIEVDINTMESKYIATYELIRGNQDFFNRNLGINKSQANRSDEEFSYGDSYFEEEESNGKRHKKDRSRKDYKAQRREKHGYKVNDEEKKEPKKAKFNPNRDDDYDDR